MFFLFALLLLPGALFGSYCKVDRIILKDLSQNHKNFHFEQFGNFEELIITWNGMRPQSALDFFISCQGHDGVWQPYKRVFRWGSHQQWAYCSDISTLPFKGRAYRIRVEGRVARDLHNTEVIFVTRICAIDRKIRHEKYTTIHIDGFAAAPPNTIIRLPRGHFPSLTSDVMCMAALIHHLSGEGVDIEQFYDQIYDHFYKTHFNWSFLIAQSYVSLLGKWNIYLKHMAHFEDVVWRLQQGIPVMVAVRDSANTPQKHYVIVGYSAATDSVQYVEPDCHHANFQEKAMQLKQFLEKWHNCYNVAFVFYR